MQVLSNYLLNLLSENAIATGSVAKGPLNGAMMILFTNVIVPTPETVLSNLTQPTYTGYAPIAVTWSAIFTLPSGNYCVESQAILWQMGNALLPTTIIGFALTDGTGTNLLLTEVFNAPRNLVAATDAITVISQFANGNPGFGKSSILPWVA